MKIAQTARGATSMLTPLLAAGRLNSPRRYAPVGAVRYYAQFPDQYEMIGATPELIP